MTFALNPGPLHWIERGDHRNPRIVFLHGFMGSNQDWEEIMEELAPDYHCLAMDLPGHGRSLGLNLEAYEMAGTAQLIHAALAQPSDSRLNSADLIVGYSMGGRLSLFLSLRFPQSFPQAQIISGSPGLAAPEAQEARRALDLARCIESKENFNSFLRKWYKQPLFNTLWKTFDPNILIQQRLRNIPEELCRSLKYLGLGAQPNLWRELACSEAKLHQIVGELDPKFVEISRQMVACNPKLGLTIVPGVSHNIPYENPNVIVQKIRHGLEHDSTTGAKPDLPPGKRHSGLD